VFAFVAGPLTARLGQPGAAPYVAVLSTGFALELLGVVPNAILQRRFRFGWMNASLVAGAALYFVLEIVLAVAGWGAWAVVVGQVADSALGLVISAVGAAWLPRLRFSRRIVNEDLKLTGGMSLVQVLGYVQKNADYWAVSSVLGGPALGIYYVAYVLPNVIRQRISTVLRQVMLPAYATSTSVEETGRLWGRTFPGLAGVALPALIGSAAVAGPLVRVFFGDQWEGAVAPMRILTVATVVDLLIAAVGTMAIVHRRIRGNVIVGCTRAVSTVLLAFAAAHVWRSTIAVAWAVAVSALLAVIVQDLLVSRPLGIGLSAIWRPLLGYLALSLAMVACIGVAAVALPGSEPPVIRLVVLVLVGTVAYVGIGWVVARRLLRPVLSDARAIVLGR
jgi:O-antigen/teichoic acid export membrane protein